MTDPSPESARPPAQTDHGRASVTAALVAVGCAIAGFLAATSDAIGITMLLAGPGLAAAIVAVVCGLRGIERPESREAAMTGLVLGAVVGVLMLSAGTLLVVVFGLFLGAGGG